MDVLSGSWPGELYLFAGRTDRTFAAGETLRIADGRRLNVGSAARPHALDWNRDGAHDLLVGTLQGKLFLIACDKPGQAMAPVEIELRGLPEQPADLSPTTADWDGDGLHDLIVGIEDGSVFLFRRLTNAAFASFGEAERLLPPSPAQWKDDTSIQPDEWGLRVVPMVVDFNGDGRLDLLLGDYCGGFQGKPFQLPEEAAEETAASERLKQARVEWTDAYKALRAASATNRDATSSEVTALREEMVRLQKTLATYAVQSQRHGYVWLFERRAAEK